MLEMYEHHPEQDDLGTDDLSRIFGAIGATIADGLRANTTKEGRIKKGVARASEILGELRTPYGTFGQEYVYTDGCIPLTELISGIEVIETKVRTAKGEILTYLIGKKQPQDENYHMGVYDIDQSTGTASRLAACEMTTDSLPDQIAIDEPLLMPGYLAGPTTQRTVRSLHGIELADAVVTQVRGLTNLEERMH